MRGCPVAISRAALLLLDREREHRHRLEVAGNLALDAEQVTGLLERVRMAMLFAGPQRGELPELPIFGEPGDARPHLAVVRDAVLDHRRREQRPAIEIAEQPRRRPPFN